MSLYVRARIASSDFDISAFETLFEFREAARESMLTAFS